MRKGTIPVGLLVSVLVCLPAPAQDPPLTAEKILTIGPGSAKGPYLFLNIEAVRTDGSGNIYVLDSRRAKIVKFSPAGEFLSVIGRPVFEIGSWEEEKNLPKMADDFKAKVLAARTTGDLYSPRDLHMGDGNILVTDIDKLVLFDLSGTVKKVVAMKWMSSPLGAYQNDRGDLTVLGSAADDFLFHVLDGAGNAVRSYGDLFGVPPEISEKWSGDTKNMKVKMAGMPVSYFNGPGGESLLIDRFRYEIRVYREERLLTTLSGPLPYSSGFGGFSESRIDGKLASIIGGSVAPPRIFGTSGLILVFQARDRGNVGTGYSRIFRVDVFKSYRLAKSFDLSMEGYPNHVDSEGRLFSTGSYRSPFINAYSLLPLLD